jgi:CheY-like chemotaxis protein
MPQGGRLAIETANVVVTEAAANQHLGLAPGRYVTVSVSDTGVGMDDTVKQHLFEPFFTTKESGKGTGLGLATCYGIVKQHGGYISADSQLGRGTVFTIYLPLAVQPSDDLPMLTEREDLPHGRETVLLVEDEPAVRSLAVRVLRQQGYVILEATNGSEALRIVETQPHVAIDLVLTDVVMPQMGGQALVNLLRAKLPSVKILFMSGYPDRSFNQDGTLDANINFLQKPFLPGVLARKVRDVLES